MKAKKTAAKAANPEAEEHVKTLIRRGNWIEQRIAACGPESGGAQHDLKELKALVWALGAAGVAYKPAPPAAEDPGETPPLRPSETWSPPDRLPRGNRYYPGGEL